MSKRSDTIAVAVLAGIGVLGVIFWAFTQWWPYIPTGEGPKKENYPWP